MIAAVFILQVILLFLVAAFCFGYFYHGRRYRFTVDAERIADGYAAQLLNDYRGDVGLLNERGTKEQIRSRYILACSELGLPETAVDKVVNLAWRRLSVAQQETPTEAVESLYE